MTYAEEKKVNAVLFLLLHKLTASQVTQITLAISCASTSKEYVAQYGTFGTEKLREAIDALMAL